MAFWSIFTGAVEIFPGASVSLSLKKRIPLVMAAIIKITQVVIAGFKSCCNHENFVFFVVWGKGGVFVTAVTVVLSSSSL